MAQCIVSCIYPGGLTMSSSTTKHRSLHRSVLRWLVCVIAALVSLGPGGTARAHEGHKALPTKGARVDGDTVIPVPTNAPQDEQDGQPFSAAVIVALCDANFTSQLSRQQRNGFMALFGARAALDDTTSVCGAPCHPPPVTSAPLCDIARHERSGVQLS